MAELPHKSLKTRGFSCIYNPDHFEADRVKDLLADNASKLFANREEIFRSANGISYRIEIPGRTCFAKEITHTKTYRHLLDRFVCPTSYRNYWNAKRLMAADLPTPVPLIAGYIGASAAPRQFIVTEFCEEAYGLGDYFRKSREDQRRDLALDVACLLTEFHCKGFYSRHLRAANILVQGEGRRRQFWFIDLDKMGTTQFSPQRNFTSTITRACSEFYEDLRPEERNFLLRSCFDFGLKHNVFSRPSQQEAFLKIAIAQIRKRG